MVDNDNIAAQFLLPRFGSDTAYFANFVDYAHIVDCFSRIRISNLLQSTPRNSLSLRLIITPRQLKVILQLADLTVLVKQITVFVLLLVELGLAGLDDSLANLVDSAYFEEFSVFFDHFFEEGCLHSGAFSVG